MTVTELIEKLRELDGNLNVYVRGYEYGVDDITIEQGYVIREANDPESWWAGRHDFELEERHLYDKGPIEAAIKISAER